jgi:AraC-like DNA-binding protein
MNSLQITPESKDGSKNERQKHLPAGIGRGGVEEVALGSGSRMLVTNYKLHSATLMEYISFPAVCGFGFCLSGDIFSHPAGFKAPDPVRSGQSALFHFDSGRMTETVGTRQVIRLNIMMAPEAFQNLLEKDPERTFPALHLLAHRPQRILGVLTPAMRNTILQILDCPYEGMTRDFFMESKALELIALKLDQLEEGKSRFRGRYALNNEDVDKTRYAAQLITRDLETPPNISELLGQVGMCRSKLHQCFREVYGMTPFDYLRHKRLETAERLLQHGELNVTQAAYAVGYSSLSHFTKAFKEHTGYLPGQCRKERSSDSIRSLQK